METLTRFVLEGVCVSAMWGKIGEKKASLYSWTRLVSQMRGFVGNQSCLSTFLSIVGEKEATSDLKGFMKSG